VFFVTFVVNRETFMDPEWRARYEAAQEVATKAGQLALRYFDAPLTVEWKADQSPVTVADREAEELLRTTLLEHFPGDGFLGEESGYAAGSTGFRWIIDPIDATRNYIRGVPIWAVLVGLEYKDEQIAGVIEVPALGHSYRAMRGEGAYRGDRRIHVSTTAVLEESIVYYSGLSWFLQAGQGQAFLDLVEQTGQQRGFGDFYGHVLVAQGSGEIMVDHGVHAWDLAALKPLIEEAGGRLTDWSGKPNIHQPDVVVSNGLLHAQALEILRSRSRS
jgi:histidinol-phosphatase